MTYHVLVDDNFHSLDIDHRYELGAFASLAAAIEAAQQVVDTFLLGAYRPGMTAFQLFQHYTMFGEDPFISAPGLPGNVFSAWDYARQRCEALCGSAG